MITVVLLLISRASKQSAQCDKEAVFVNHLNLAAVDRNVKMNRKKGHDTKIVSYHSNFFSYYEEAATFQ